MVKILVFFLVGGACGWKGGAGGPWAIWFAWPVNRYNLKLFLKSSLDGAKLWKHICVLGVQNKTLLYA
jgi:hypothetical protein